MKLLACICKTGAIPAFGFVVFLWGEQSDAKPAKITIYAVNEIHLSVSAITLGNPDRKPASSWRAAALEAPFYQPLDLRSYASTC